MAIKRRRRSPAALQRGGARARSILTPEAPRAQAVGYGRARLSSPLWIIGSLSSFHLTFYGWYDFWMEALFGYFADLKDTIRAIFKVARVEFGGGVGGCGCIPNPPPFFVPRDPPPSRGEPLTLSGYRPELPPPHGAWKEVLTRSRGRSLDPRSFGDFGLSHVYHSICGMRPVRSFAAHKAW